MTIELNGLEAAKQIAEALDAAGIEAPEGYDMAIFVFREKSSETIHFGYIAQVKFQKLRRLMRMWLKASRSDHTFKNEKVM